MAWWACWCINHMPNCQLLDSSLVVHGDIELRKINQDGMYHELTGDWNGFIGPIFVFSLCQWIDRSSIAGSLKEVKPDILQKNGELLANDALKYLQCLDLMVHRYCEVETITWLALLWLVLPLLSFGWGDQASMAFKIDSLEENIWCSNKSLEVRWMGFYFDWNSFGPNPCLYGLCEIIILVWTIAYECYTVDVSGVTTLSRIIVSIECILEVFQLKWLF